MAKKHKVHDSGYKKLFSNPELIRQLLTSFVDEEWTAEIDYSSLQRIDKSFITDEFAGRESDIIFKGYFKGKEVYIFILLEFQSTVDRFMALRMLRYISELYEDLVKNQKLKTLPAIFPVMLYNGEKRWTAPEELSNLIEETIPEKYIPKFRYYKIAENEYGKEFLKSLKNAVAALFYTETCTSEELQQEINVIVDLLQTEKPDEKILFTNWFRYMFQGREELIEEVQGIEEVKSMLRSSIKQIAKESKLEGKLEAKLETAGNLLKEKMSVTKISRITGLPVAEIENLKNKSCITK